MDANAVVPHISHQFDHELEDICNKVLVMGRLVEQQIDLAISTFLTGNTELAEQVIKQDVQVNAMETDISQECVSVIALRQPMASDLRVLIAVIKILTEIERQGDLAKNIAQMAIHLASDNHHVDSYYELRHIAEMAKKTLHQVLDAFAKKDMTMLLTGMTGQDESLKREYKSIVRQIITQMMENPACISRSLDVLWAAKALEKIADHACNIAEHIIYMVKGENVQHAHGEAGFCHSCSHLVESDEQYHCQLKQLPLTEIDTEKICADYSRDFNA